MANENIQSVIARVRALFALADPEKNTNEAEAASARRAADKLIQEHRISMAELEASGETKAEHFVSRVVQSNGRRVGWQEIILSCLTTHYGGAFYCETFRSGGMGGRGGGIGGKGTNSYTVFARESDLAIIEYLFSYLIGQVDRISKFHSVGKGMKYAASFRVGMAAGIASQFKDLQKEMENNNSQSTAIVLLSNRSELAKQEMHSKVKLKTGTSIGQINDYDAQNAGYREGRKVEINKTGLNAFSDVKKLK